MRTTREPSEIMDPHDGVGGFTPRPMNDRNASVVMYPGIANVSATTNGPKMLGRICLNMMRRSLVPMVRAASMYSFWRTESTCPRVRRAIVSHAVSPMPTKMKSRPPSFASAWLNAYDIVPGSSLVVVPRKNAIIRMMNSRLGNP